MQVYWDGYGLGNPYSGIYQQACFVFSELKKLSVNPKLILPFDHISHKTVWPSESILYSGANLSALLKNKAIWPIVSANIAQKSLKSSREKAIFHAMSNINLPLCGFSRLKKVITVHDLIPLLVKDGVSKRLRIQFKILLKSALKNADAIVVGSKWTEECLHSFFPELDRRVVFIPYGRSASTSPIDSRTRKSEQSERKILTISRFEGYKGFDILLEIIKESPSEFKFCLITDKKGQQFFSKHLKIPDKLEVFSEISNEQKLAIIRRSDIYLHPSHFEGFGIPLIEALEQGVPVVYRAGTGVDEAVVVCASRAVIDPERAQSWIEAIYNLDELVSEPNFLENLHRELALKPSWSVTARLLANLYESL